MLERRCGLKIEIERADRWLQASISIIGPGFRETDFRNAKRKDSAC